MLVDRRRRDAEPDGRRPRDARLVLLAGLFALAGTSVAALTGRAADRHTRVVALVA